MLRYLFIFLLIACGASAFGAADRFCADQLTFDLEITGPLVLATNHMSDASLIPMRRKQLENQLREEGFVSFNGLHTLMQLAHKNQGKEFRFILQKGKTLQVVGGHIRSVEVAGRISVMVLLTDGEHVLNIPYTGVNNFFIFHPNGPSATLF